MPTGTAWDYQLGGDRPVPDEVGIVVRDRTSEPLESVYNICYVNGFQTQPGAKKFWRDHWRLVLKQGGKPVVDGAWGEWLLDIGTPAKRRALARIVGRWTAGCAEDGFDAVEYDNLDSFSRSKGGLDARDATKFAALLVARAHDEGLAAAQKNRAGWDGTTVGYDFAIAEECAQWRSAAGTSTSTARRCSPSSTARDRSDAPASSGRTPSPSCVATSRWPSTGPAPGARADSRLRVRHPLTLWS